MTAPTSPAIFAAQNTQDARRRVAAQARLYTEAKRVWAVRVAAVFVLAVASGAAALATANSARTAIGVGGGVLLLVLSIVGGDVEKRKRHQAAAVQEEFDTAVFRLPWNDLDGARPSPTVIAQAAARYDGGRDKDWYPDTEDTHRPFDVLICQSSNLGWGSSTHRAWGWLLMAALAALAAFVAGLALLFHLDANDLFAAVIAPAVAPVKELVEQIKSHFETARDKSEVDSRISSAWAAGMAGDVPSEELLRRVQDRILAFRRRNHYVPDWLDNRLRDRNEAVMATTAADKAAEAARAGYG
jgi:hypothetical protein